MSSKLLWALQNTNVTEEKLLMNSPHKSGKSPTHTSKQNTDKKGGNPQPNTHTHLQEGPMHYAGDPRVL